MAALDPDRARSLVAGARVGRLGTVTPGGRPHLVPCCYALVGDRIYSVVDGKPKSTAQLKRLANVRANPAASLLVDHYDDDWARLWWVRVDGRARIIERAEGPGARDGRDDEADEADDESDDESDEYEVALEALAARYRQYRAERPSGPVLAIDIERLTGWAFSP